MQLSDITQGEVDLLSLDTYEYYRGYTVLITEWLVAAANCFPLTWQPHLYLFIGSVFMAVAVLVTVSSGIYSSKLVLTLAPVVLFFAAFTDPAFYITLTGVLFSSTALLMAIAFKPLPKSGLKLCMSLILVAILAFSGPYGTVLLPLSIALILYFGTRKNILFLSFIACLSVMYILSAESGMVALSNVFNPDVRMVFFRYLVEHILLLGLFPGVDYPIGFLLIFIALVPLIAYRKDTLFVKMSLIFIATALASFTTYFLSNKFAQYMGEVISSHTVIAQFCWLLFVLLCIDRVAIRVSNKVVTSILACITIAFFSWVIVNKQAAVARHVVLKPDSDLGVYLSAVESAKAHVVSDNEFLQLWHIDRLGFISSFRKGDGSQAVEKGKLPEYMWPFYSTQNFDRKSKSMFTLDSKENAINVYRVGDQRSKIQIVTETH